MGLLPHFELAPILDGGGLDHAVTRLQDRCRSGCPTVSQFRQMTTTGAVHAQSPGRLLRNLYVLSASSGSYSSCHPTTAAFYLPTKRRYNRQPTQVRPTL